MENLAFSLSSRAAGSSCDPLPQLICFTHESDFGPIPSKAPKPWDTRARTTSFGEQAQPVSSADALAAKQAARKSCTAVVRADHSRCAAVIGRARRRASPYSWRGRIASSDCQLPAQAARHVQSAASTGRHAAARDMCALGCHEVEALAHR